MLMRIKLIKLKGLLRSWVELNSRLDYPADSEGTGPCYMGWQNNLISSLFALFTQTDGSTLFVFESKL
jgi:hypothetical protein